MTREQFARSLAKAMKEAGIKITTPGAAKLVVAIFQSVGEGLARDRKVIISNFGAFEATKVGSKIINSPRGDNRKFFMPPTDIIKWHPSGKIRVRGETQEISDEEHKQLIGHGEFEPEPETAEVEIVVPEPKRKNPYEVEIKVVKSGKGHIADDQSPISRLVKSLLISIKDGQADKVEIKPTKEISEICYFSAGKKTKSARILRDTHEVVVEKIKNSAIPSSDNPKILIMSLSETLRVTIVSDRSPFGEIITLSVIK